jgi:replicative DNA helicase
MRPAQLATSGHHAGAKIVKRWRHGSSGTRGAAQPATSATCKAYGPTFSRQLKLLAKELECPVVAVCQLNRGPEQRTDKKPMVSDLRESGSLEQDADMVILLHRPDAIERDDPRGGEADLILGKHRNGPTATITVAHQLHLSRFVDMARG